MKKAFIHLVHGIFPFMFEKKIHSRDDGDPTPRQQKILDKTGNGYLTHLLLNFFLGYNHIRVNSCKFVGKKRGKQ
jgi:hypothetical protein